MVVSGRQCKRVSGAKWALVSKPQEHAQDAQLYVVRAGGLPSPGLCAGGAT